MNHTRTLSFLAATALAFTVTLILTPAAQASVSVSTSPASGITANSATLNGGVNAGAVIFSNSPGTAHFQYCLTTNYGSATTTTPLPPTNTSLSRATRQNHLSPRATHPSPPR